MKKNKDHTYHFDITVSGRVQGVGYRYSAENMARQYGIFGSVRNMASGSVFLEIEGSKIATDLMINWCNQGPGTSRIEEVIVHEGKVKGYDSFKVIY